MAGTLRVLRRRIRAVTQTKQITKAMELVATSRIAKAQQRVEASLPYTNELTRALSALASNSTTDHPLLAERREPAPGRDPGHHQRPRAGRGVQLQRAAHGQRAGVAAARGGQGAGPVRDRPQGLGVLPLPQPRGRQGVDRLLRAAGVHRRPRGRGHPGEGVPGRRDDDGDDDASDAGRRTAWSAWTRSTSSTPSSSRCSARTRWPSGSRRWWSRRARRRPPRATSRRTSSSRSRTSCSARCCRSTSTPASTPRCWSRRPRSRRPGGGR